MAAMCWAPSWSAAAPPPGSGLTGLGRKGEAAREIQHAMVHHSPRTAFRSLLSARVNVSSRAATAARSADSANYEGIRRCAEDPYDPVSNPDSIVQLGLAENQLSLDLIEEWLAAFDLKGLLVDGAVISVIFSV